MVFYYIFFSKACAILKFITCLKKSIKNVKNWNTDSIFQKKKIKQLSIDLEKTIKYLETINVNKKFLFNEIYKWAENQVCDECLEYLVSIFMEPFDEIVNKFKDKMSSDEDRYFTIPTERKTSELRDILEKNYSDIENNSFTKRWLDLKESNCDCEANLYEAKVNPILKFIHTTNINPCGWIEINDSKKTFFTKKS